MHIRCSGLARPMICAGFLFLDLPDDSGVYNKPAEEGTAAGEYVELSLLGKPIGVAAANGYPFDADMKFYGDPIVAEIKARAAGPIACEHRIDWETKSGITIKGQPDVSYVDHQGRLCVDDYKYGWGIHEVKEHWQLLGYAIGEVIKRGVAFKEICLRILQPRPHHEDGIIREWVLTYDELLAYKDTIEVRMQSIVDGQNNFQTSSKCKYCKGAAEACPAFSKLFYRALEVSSEFIQDSIDNDELARQLDSIKRAEEVIKIKKDSLTELGILRIKENQIIPGYLQTKKYGNRTWKKGISPESIKIMSGKNIIEETIMTPAKAEKAGVSKELVKQITEKYYKGTFLEKRDSTELGNEIFGTTDPTGGK